MGQGKNQMVVKNYLESDENRNVKTTQPLKKEEILPFGTTWMDLASIMLSEISHTEKDKYLVISLICGI